MDRIGRMEELLKRMHGPADPRQNPSCKSCSSCRPFAWLGRKPRLVLPIARGFFRQQHGGAAFVANNDIGATVAVRVGGEDLRADSGGFVDQMRHVVRFSIASAAQEKYVEDGR